MISKLEIRSVERGICPIATSTINERTIPIIMAGCMAHEREGIYFHFRCKIWRHSRVTRPRFPSRCANFGDSAM